MAQHGQPQHPYGGQPPWWGYPPMWQQPQQDRPPIPEIVVPGRVDQAMAFLELMTIKTSKRAVANDISIEVIPGQTLTPAEDDTMIAACELIKRYFNGKLPVDIWEEVKLKALHKQQNMIGKTGRLLNCIACDPGPPNPKCPLCSGTGRVLVVPVGPNDIMSEQPVEPQAENAIQKEDHEQE